MVVHQHQPKEFTFTHYNKGSKVDKDHQHEFTFAIKEKNIDLLESLLANVSDPRNVEYYGKYFSKNEIEKMTFNKEGFDAVKKFCIKHNLEILGEYNQLIKVRAPIQKLVEMFETEFYTYHKSPTNKNKWDKNEIVRCSSYSVPAALEGHVVHIYSLADIPPPIYGSNPPISKIENYTISSSNSSNSRKLAISYGVTPTVLYDFYGITGSVTYGNQSIFASLDQTYSVEDLSDFQSYFDLDDNPVVDNVNRGPKSTSYCDTNVDDCAEASLDIQYITAVGINGPTTYWYQTEDRDYYIYADNLFLEWAYNVSYTEFPPLVHSISYGGYEIFMNDAILDLFSVEMIKLGLRGITVIAASGDDGVAGFLLRSGTGNSLSQCGMYASFPASCPYVTSIGATSGAEMQDTSTTEIASSARTGQAITTGGGFSNYYSILSWQSSAVNTYIDNNEDESSAYTGYRGYPDVSMAGEDYVVLIGGYGYYVSGTSASAPVFAGLVSLVNSYRLSQGWSSLGFMNSAIYANDGIFANDILSGDNYCTSQSSRCCTSVGFTCDSSWDPVTGFGTINYDAFLSYFSTEIPSTGTTPTKKPVKPPTSKPSKTPTTKPTFKPTLQPSYKPSRIPTIEPTAKPSEPSYDPTLKPSGIPTMKPTAKPTIAPSFRPSRIPTMKPTRKPTVAKPTRNLQ